MSNNTTELSSDNFDEKIKKGNWIVDFWAAWCGPCRILGPIIDEVAGELKGKVNVGKVDVDSESDLAQMYEVMSIPTVIFFKDGRIVNKFVGVQDKEDIIALAEESF